MTWDEPLDVGDTPAAEPARRRFAALVERLQTGPETNGFGYEQLRRRLILFFRQHEPIHADELADDALDRLARRLDEGKLIAQPALYAFGIAKLMLLEVRARRAREDTALHDPAFPIMADEEEGIDPALLAALRGCLVRLGRAGADLILAYYREDDARRIGARRELARALGVSANTLRNRALRLRSTLEACVRDRVGDSLPGQKRDGIAQTDTKGDD